MAEKKKAPKNTKKPASVLKPLTEKQKAAFRREVDADMKKHGFKTLEELDAYYDSLRGY